MTGLKWKWVLVASLLAGGVGLCSGTGVSSMAWGQEEKPSASGKATNGRVVGGKATAKKAASRAVEGDLDGDEMASDSTKTKRGRTESRGRLPAYYGDLVDTKQRESIYAVQARYHAEMKVLREQITSLEAKVEEEMEAVLTDEQRDKLHRWREEGKAKRIADATRKRPEEDPQ